MFSAAAKFRTWQLVHNRITKEDGFISDVFLDKNKFIYEVWVPRVADSWAAGNWVSHWLEGVLKHSGNKHLGSPPSAVWSARAAVMKNSKPKCS